MSQWTLQSTGNPEDGQLDVLLQPLPNSAAKNLPESFTVRS